MNLTRFTDYSLRTLMFLAAAPQRKATVSEIARAFDISENHLVKVVHYLGKHGWVETVRGKGGGVHLTKAPADVTLGNIVRDTEREDAPAECFTTESSCVLASCCQLKRALSEALEAFYRVLDDYTLADITGNRQELAVLLRLVPA